MTQFEEKSAQKSSGRILELDAIRALSCLNLLLFHFTFVYQNKYGFNSDFGLLFPYGKYGVQLFFMLSGLVNALTLLKKRKPSDFIVSRCIRIFPSYWLVILMNVVLFATIPIYHQSVAMDATVANLSTMPQLFGFENMEPVTWTLQIEMLFYFFLMSMFILGLLDKPMRTMMVAVAICLVSCLAFDWLRAVHPNSVWNARCKFVEDLFFMRNLPLFAMGILLNELRCQRGKPWVLWLGIVVSGIVFHVIDLRNHNPAATVLLFGMLAAGAFGKLPFLRFRPLIYISFISYTLYLFHNNLGSGLMYLVQSWGCPPLLTILIATAFSIGIASMVTYWFEQPITKFLLKAWKQRSILRAPSFPKSSEASPKS